VDLRDGRGGERLGLEPGKRLLPEVFAHDPLGLGEREGRHLVHELAELLDVDIREEVRSRREQLPELQVGGAELLERVAELNRAVPRGRPVPTTPSSRSTRRRRPRRTTRVTSSARLAR
jgi:hypothetical protein